MELRRLHEWMDHRAYRPLQDSRVWRGTFQRHFLLRPGRHAILARESARRHSLDQWAELDEPESGFVHEECQDAHSDLPRGERRACPAAAELRDLYGLEEIRCARG